MTTGVMDANIFILQLEGNTIGCGTSHSISLTADTRDITCKTGTGSQTYRKFVSSFKSGTVSFEGLHAEDDSDDNVYDVFALYNASTRVAFKVGSTITGDNHFAGNGYITSLEVNGGGPGENTTYSGTITIDGAVTVVTNA